MSRHATPLVAFIAATTLLGSCRPGYPPPPATRADPVTVTIHGVDFPERGGHAANRGRPLSLQVQDAARELGFMAEPLGLQLWGVEP